MIWTAEEIQEKRRVAHSQAVQRLGGQAEVPSLEEALLLMEFHRGRVEAVCAALGLQANTMASGLWLLGRFYLCYSILDFDPKHVMLAAVLVASKVDGHHLTMEEMAVTKADPTMLMDLEVILLEAMDFDLALYDPFTAAYALRCLWGEADRDWKGVEERIKRVIVYSDALLRYPAAKIALWATQPTAEELQAFGNVPLEDLGHLPTTAQGNLDLYKAIDRRVILCRNTYQQNKQQS